MDFALGTTCHRFRRVHVLIVERERRHLVQFRPPEVLDHVAAKHAVALSSRHGRLLVVLAQLLACGALSAAARFSWSNAL